MIDTDKYEGHTEGRWEYYYDPNCDDWILKTSRYIHSGKGVRMKKDSVDAQLIADAPLLLEFIEKVVEEWGKPNQCNQAFGKDVRHLMLMYGLINYNEETKRYEVKE